MSLLEDIFLQDEADEARELERVIEGGDDYDERPRSRSQTPNSDENEPKEDEAEEEKRRVDPTSTKIKRVSKNPRLLLNPARLTGPRGIQVIPDHFKDFKFKGKGHEKEDLDMVLKKLEHWAYRLYPKFQFEDCLKKIEMLGKRKPVMVHLHKIRTDQFMSGEMVVQKDSSDEETQPPQQVDEFDKLLQQQIDLARATPVPDSVNKVLDTPIKDRSPFTMPKATSSPSISDEQKERMIRNRQLAERRRLARLKQNSMNTSSKQDSGINEIIEVEENVESVTAKKNNRSRVVDSSDDECDVTSVNQSVTIDIHVRSSREALNDGNKIPAGSNVDMVQNNAIEVDENVDKMNNIEENVTTNHNKKNAEIIEIYDQADKLDDVEIHYPNRIDEGLIEINDGNGKGFDEVIEINDQITKENASTVKTPLTPNIENNENNCINNKNKSLSNNDSILRQNVEQGLVEEILSKQDGVLQNDTLSNGNKVEPRLEKKDSDTADEVLEDIMDVDFSDDL